MKKGVKGLKIEYIPVTELEPYEKNARKHGEEDIEAIRASIREFGFNDPIGIWKDKIVEGHGRLMAAKAEGMTEVPIIRLDHLTDEQRRAYALAHNRTAELSEWDTLIRDDELKNITEIDMSAFGFDLTELEDPAEVVEDDFDVEVPEEPVAQFGQIWVLGKHRLMCGDSTDPEMVSSLMGGVKADLVFTDPPYGVSYTDKNEFLNSIDKPICVVNAIQNDDHTPEEMHDFWVSAFRNAYENSKDKMSYYITAPQGGDLLLLLLQAVRESGFALKHQLIWNKNNHVLGRCDYNYKHEPIVYGWKIKGTHEFQGNGKMKTSVWDVAKPLRSDLHPTMKPIELIANAILNSSKEGDVVLDLFGGSGSTLIACEQTGRTCCMMEYDPHYVDVIIKRWERFTGETATLLD